MGFNNPALKKLRILRVCVCVCVLESVSRVIRNSTQDGIYICTSSLTLMHEMRERVADIRLETDTLHVNCNCLSSELCFEMYFCHDNSRRDWHGNVHNNVNVFGLGRTDLLRCCCRPST